VKCQSAVVATGSIHHRGEWLRRGTARVNTSRTENVSQTGEMTTKDTLFRAVTSLHRAIFSATNGKVAGRGMGMPILVLTTTGRTSGKLRETMLSTPLVEGDTVILVASFGGDDREPSWCKNIRENPAVEIDMEGRKRAMTAHVADAAERADLWPKITSAHANYAGYQRKTDREIPVVILDPVS
jgi:deazaflavin-dependent oxidoreductase (nitroreductase family)